MFVTLALRGLLGTLLAVGWEGVRLLNGAAWSWPAVFQRLGMILVVLFVVHWADTHPNRWRSVAGAALLLAVAGCLLGLHWADTRLAWLGVTSLFTLAAVLESAFYAGARQSDSRLSPLAYAGSLLALAALAGGTPVLLAQVESQFGEEEFFAAVNLLLAVLFALLLLLVHILARRLERDVPFQPRELNPLQGTLLLLLVGGGLGVWGAAAYRSSFYSPDPPFFAGVSAETPFLCADLTPEVGSPDGEAVFQRILAAVEANPHKGAPEYGMLALATGEQPWADVFRETLLKEAAAGHYTEPANSVKYGQRQAAQRVYYFVRVRDAFPELFSAPDLEQINTWLAAVNRRALTAEWVDLLYGLAFSVWPEGPYENQENGAGLLSLLEWAGLGDPQLSAANRDYLARNPRGWAQRFRNSDDAYLYQVEWIENALFQSLYRGDAGASEPVVLNERLAFEWLLLQMLPDGAPLTYNRPGAQSIANTLYLGALLLDDPRYVWATDRALDGLAAREGYLTAQPGLEQAAGLAASAPAQGSCLLFSPSGLPTQVGPLSPDKVVLRDGWTADATYALLNLRFTGWHRYKATNELVLLYQDGPLVVEGSAARTLSWLPTGRSQVRDKRLPRESLNGLLIPRTGFSQVVFSLTGAGSQWAQDPPHYARVEGFFTSGLVDASHTLLEDWRGWDHRRSVYLIHQGPVIVIDEARATGGGEAALVWHVSDVLEQTEDGLWIRDGAAGARMAWAPGDTSSVTVTPPDLEGADEAWTVTMRSPERGHLEQATAFLVNGWDGAAFDAQTVMVGGASAGQLVRLQIQDQVLRLLHNGSGAPIEAQGLYTDGRALLVSGDPATPDRPAEACRMGGSVARLSGVARPDAVVDASDGAALRSGQEWRWEDGTLVLEASTAEGGCVRLVYSDAS